MPQLTVRGIEMEVMRSMSKEMIEELAKICECGTDNFTIDCLPVISVFEGEQVLTYPFIEIAWFERGQVVRDQIAQAVTRHILSSGIKEVEIAFKVYREDNYYINGNSCAD
jgi:phenylpyruvate tautomerase PptA (4-oxalocrotonate tautomerase family)